MSDLDGYEPDDPKSPGYADRIFDRADNRRKQHPDVVFDKDNAPIGVNWKKEVA